MKVRPSIAGLLLSVALAVSGAFAFSAGLATAVYADGPRVPSRGALGRIRSYDTVGAVRVGPRVADPTAERRNDPEHFAQSKVLARGAGDAGWARRAIALFGDPATWAPDSVCALCLTCPDRQRYGLRFSSAKRLVDVLVLPAERVLLIQEDGVWRGGSFAAVEDSVLAILRQAFPKDSFLAAPLPEAETARAYPESPNPNDAYFIKPPVAIHTVPPVYPDMTAGLGLDGDVLIRALVGEDGRVSQTVVVKSVPLLDQASIAAIREWRFRPATCAGRDVAMWAEIPVRFRLH